MDLLLNNIASAIAGMYFPAYDSPAMYNGILEGMFNLCKQLFSKRTFNPYKKSSLVYSIFKGISFSSSA